LKNIDDNTDGYRVEWFKELFRNPEFVARVNELYEERAKAAFDTQKVMNAIDYWQAQLMPSLLMNHVKWVVFYNTEHTADELVSTGTVDRIAYTTNKVKSVLTNKKAYMDVAYGEYMPTLSYVSYNTSGTAQKNYTGGCATYSSPMAGLSVELKDSIFDGRIDYRLNIDGTLTDVSTDGDITRAAGGFESANGIYVKLFGNVSEYFTIQYRVHINGRWGSWISDGNYSGRSSSGGGRYFVDRVQMRLLKKKDVSFVNVDYVADGMDTVSEDVVAGNVIKTDYAPKKLGYDFTGWYSDAELTTPFDVGTVAEEGVSYTLYAGFEERAVLPGDANGDGKINATDLVYIKQFIACHRTESELIVENADYDGDGKVNAKDLTAIKKFIATGE